MRLIWKAHQKWWPYALPVAVVMIVAQKEHSIEVFSVAVAVYTITFVVYSLLAAAVVALMEKLRNTGG